MTYFCPNCWKDFREDKSVCPFCGFRVKEFWESKDMVKKLIHSLHHPDSQTSLRAVWLLGKLKAPQAVTPLISLFGETEDIYLAKAVVIALGRIGGSEALSFLKNQATHPVKMIRDIIKTILGNIDSNMFKKQSFKTGGKL